MRKVSGTFCRLGVMLFVFTLIEGCSITIHKSVSPELATRTPSVNVYSTISKEEISTYIDPKRTIGGSGLLWQAIDKGIQQDRAENAEKIIAPLLAATADVDFRSQYWAQLEKAIYSSPWLKIKKLDKRSLIINKGRVTNEDLPVLNLHTHYMLSENAQVLVVQTNAFLYLDSARKPDYFGFHTYYSNKIGKNNEKDAAAIALWVKDNAAAYRKALSEGIQQNMEMLQYDLLDGRTITADEKGTDISLDILSFDDKMNTYQGKVIKREGGRVIMRNEGGNLFSFPLSLAEK